MDTIQLVLNCTLTLFCVLAVVFNSLGIYLLSASKNLTNGKILLINLALPEIINSIGQIIINCLRILSLKKKGLIVWKIGSIGLLTYYLAMFQLTIERLIAIRFPLRHRVWLTRKRLIRIVVGVWVLSFIAGASVFLNQPFFDFIETYFWVSLNGLYLLLCVIAYRLIYCKLRRRFDIGLQQHNIANRERLAIRRDMKFIKVVALIIISFVMFVLIPVI